MIHDQYSNLPLLTSKPIAPQSNYASSGTCPLHICKNCSAVIPVAPQSGVKLKQSGDFGREPQSECGCNEELRQYCSKHYRGMYGVKPEHILGEHGAIGFEVRRGK